MSPMVIAEMEERKERFDLLGQDGRVMVKQCTLKSDGRLVRIFNSEGFWIMSHTPDRLWRNATYRYIQLV